MLTTLLDILHGNYRTIKQLEDVKWLYLLNINTMNQLYADDKYKDLRSDIDVTKNLLNMCVKRTEQLIDAYHEDDIDRMEVLMSCLHEADDTWTNNWYNLKEKIDECEQL